MDPYFEFKAEVETSLHSLSTLHSSYHRILRTVPPSSHSSSEELSWALSELKATLSALEVDVEELDESVQAVEERGVASRLGVAEGQVQERRAFVERVKKEIGTIRRSLPSSAPADPLDARKRLSANSAYRGVSEGDDEYGSADPNEEFEMQHQSLLMEQQDRTLTDISGTVDLLREQAKVMGREVLDQNVMLEEMDGHVDRTSDRLAKAQRRMQGFIRENQSSPSSWFILILIAVLFLLLILILFS